MSIVFCFVSSALGTWLLLKLLKRHKLMHDVPSARSNHKSPTPRGGGIVIVATIYTCFLLFFWPIIAMIPAIFIGGAALAAISLLDDIRPLSAKWRLLIHAITILTCSIVMFSHRSLTGGLIPVYIEIGFITLLWIWFVNLYNFMDGIDGITGTNSIITCIGIIIVTLFSLQNDAITPIAFMITASTAGFLIWNWHPAKIFMGDIGSITLGFFIGWMLLEIAYSGYPEVALIIPIYYLADSSITLLKRLLRGEKIWEAHSEHYYQKAVRSGKSHSQTVGLIATADVILITLAGISVYLHEQFALLCLALAIATTGITLFILQHRSKSLNV